MRKYELMTIFPLEDELSKVGLDGVRETLTHFGAEVKNETPFGDRDLCYELQKRNRGRYVLFVLNVNPAKIAEIDTQFKLNANLLKFMFVRVDE